MLKAARIQGGGFRADDQGEKYSLHFWVQVVPWSGLKFIVGERSMHFAMTLLQSQPDTAAVQQMVLAMFAFIPILILVGLAVTLIPVWFICKKAGFSPWLSLLCVVPMGGFVLLYVLAFADWKVVPVAQIPWTPPPPPYQPQA